MTKRVGTVKSQGAKPALNRREAEAAYDRALTDAGVTRDDLAVLREMVRHSQGATTVVTPVPTRIYL